jgi:thiosulfate sulfurtransferase
MHTRHGDNMSEFRRISPQQAQALREQGARVVDIRDAQSFSQGHISGSLHLDNVSLADFIAAADFDQPLIVSCYHGNSSQPAAAYLASQGFAEVYSLDGGFALWLSLFPAETACGSPEQQD